MGRSSKNDVIVVLPTYKEVEGVKSTIEELKRVFNPLILVIDRPVGDSTGAVAQRLGATILTQRSKGKGAALNEVLEYMRRSELNHKHFVLMDADFTYPARYIPKMIDILEANPNVGMVTGKRPNYGFNFYPLGNRFLTLIHRLLNGVKMRDPLTGLRVIRFSLIKNWEPKAKSFDIECELNHFVLRVKRRRVVEVPIEYRPRIGEKKLRARHGVTILKRILVMFLR